MDKAKTRIEKVGVAWRRDFKGGKKGIKASINKELFVFYENKRKSKDTDPDYVICRFIDSPDKKEDKK